MGVFYNPAGAIPISQIGYEGAPLSSPGVAGRQPKGRNLEAEFRDAQARANQRAGGDPLKYKAELTAEGYPLEATQFGEQYAKTKKADLDVEELETTRSIENLRRANDLLKAGRKDLALRVLNKDATPDNYYADLKYDPRTNNVSYIMSTGEKGTQNSDDIIKAATNAETQFKEQMVTQRLHLQMMRDRDKLSPTELTGIAYQMLIETERLMSTGKTYNQVIKERPDLVLMPQQKELIAKHAEGDFAPIAASIFSNNPGLLKLWGVKTPEDATKLMVNIHSNVRKELGAARTERMGPKVGEQIAPGTTIAPNTGTDRTRTSITISGKQHPAFVTKEGGVRMKSPDGKTGVVPQEKVEQAIKDGFKLE